MKHDRQCPVLCCMHNIKAISYNKNFRSARSIKIRVGKKLGSVVLLETSLILGLSAVYHVCPVHSPTLIINLNTKTVILKKLTQLHAHAGTIDMQCIRGFTMPYINGRLLTYLLHNIKS